MSDTLQYSESIAAFAPAFVELQHQLPKVVKDKTGQVGQQKTKYADFEGIVDAIKEVMHTNGFAYLQAASGGSGGMVAVTTILLHKSGEWMRDTLFMPTGGNGAQGVGSALTYGKRYGLASILGIATEDDDGHAASHNPPPARTAKPAPAAKKTGDAPAMPSPNATKKAMAQFGEAGIKERADRLAFTAWAVGHPVSSWSEVNAAEAANVITALSDLIDGKLKVVVEGDGSLTVVQS